MGEHYPTPCWGARAKLDFFYTVFVFLAYTSTYTRAHRRISLSVIPPVPACAWYPSPVPPAARTAAPVEADYTVERQTGVPAAWMAAVRSVESRGNPQAFRFEPGLFARKLRAAQDAARAEGRPIPGLDANGEPMPLPKGSTRAAFDAAYSISPALAVESTSWGLYQVLGGHGLALFGSPERFLARFQEDPELVSARMAIRWLQRSPKAVAAATANDYAAFARRYNGPNYAKTAYDAKLANAHGFALAAMRDAGTVV